VSAEIALTGKKAGKKPECFPNKRGGKMSLARFFVQPLRKEGKLGGVAVILYHIARNTTVFGSGQPGQLLQALAEFVGILR
jgi:hypothetical protein